MLFFIVMKLSNHCQDINYVHRIVRLSAWTKYLHMIDENEHVLRKLNFSVTIMYSLFYYVSKPSIHVVFFLLKTCVIIIIDVNFFEQSKSRHNVRIVSSALLLSDVH